MLFQSAEFNKRFKKLPKKLQQKVLDRLELFESDKFSEILDNHKLNGEHEGRRSIDITGNLRVIYEEVKKDVYVLVTVGTHPQLYG